MKPLSEDLRHRIVNHYKTHTDATYESTAEHFSVGEATVSRLLRLDREFGDVVPPKKPKPRKFKVDLEWLEKHALKSPNARLKDRVADYYEECGVRVSITAMWYAMRELGWTHKKRRFSPVSATRRVSRN